MQEQTTKEQATQVRRSNPIRIVDSSRIATANADALRDVHMSLVRAEQNLYNLVQASHAANAANGTPIASAGFGYATPPSLAANFVSPYATQFAGAAPEFAPASAGFVPAAGLAWPAGAASAAAWASRTLACDVADEGTQFVCVIDLPGVTADQIEVLCSEQAVSIYASRESEADVASLVQAERSNTTQQRTIALPNAIQPGAVKATISNGTLTIVLPKVQPTAGPRRIKVQG